MGSKPRGARARPPTHAAHPPAPTRRAPGRRAPSALSCPRRARTLPARPERAPTRPPLRAPGRTPWPTSTTSSPSRSRGPSPRPARMCAPHAPVRSRAPNAHPRLARAQVLSNLMYFCLCRPPQTAALCASPLARAPSRDPPRPAVGSPVSPEKLKVRPTRTRALTRAKCSPTPCSCSGLLGAPRHDLCASAHCPAYCSCLFHDSRLPCPCCCFASSCANVQTTSPTCAAAPPAPFWS